MRRRNETNEPTVSETMDALAVSVRRETLAYLFENDTAAVDELAAHLAGPDGSRERVRTNLRHAALPRLVDLGIVTVDGDEISLDGPQRRVRCFLDVADEYDN